MSGVLGDKRVNYKTIVSHRFRYDVPQRSGSKGPRHLHEEIDRLVPTKEAFVAYLFAHVTYSHCTVWKTARGTIDMEEISLYPWERKVRGVQYTRTFASSATYQ